MLLHATAKRSWWAAITMMCCLVQGTGPDLPHLLCVVDISGKGIFAALLMSQHSSDVARVAEP